MTSLVDLISEDVTLRRSGKEWMGCCPFHEEKTPSFSVSEEKQVYFCFACNEGGDAISYLRKKRGYSYQDAARYVGKALSEPETQRNTREQATLDRIKVQFLTWRRTQLQAYNAELDDLSLRIFIADTACRAIGRAPDLYTADEQDSWGREVAEANGAFAEAAYYANCLHDFQEAWEIWREFVAAGGGAA